MASPFDLRACLAGDRRAWETFVDRFSRVILAAVARTLRAYAPAAAEQVHDVTQDVFVRLVARDFRLLRNYDPARAGLATWLTIIARSTAIDHLRRRRLQTVPLPEESHREPAAPAPVDDKLELPPKLLSGRQQLVLRMLLEQRMTAKEVAAALGTDAQTIHRTKHRAIEKLREHYGEDP
jgi:RNA polymerase sigma factor (sigma-70 family)